MIWLVMQMWVLLALGFLVGLLLGLWIGHRPPRKVDVEADKELANLRARIEECDAEKTRLRAKLLEFETERAGSAPEQPIGETGPHYYDSPTDGPPDDLKIIKGIGPQLEKMLNEMGIYYFHQIAAWTDGQAATIDDRLRFKGRILRDNWRGQASAHASRRMRS